MLRCVECGEQGVECGFGELEFLSLFGTLLVEGELGRKLGADAVVVFTGGGAQESFRAVALSAGIGEEGVDQCNG